MALSLAVSGQQATAAAPKTQTAGDRRPTQRRQRKKLSAHKLSSHLPHSAAVFGRAFRDILHVQPLLPVSGMQGTRQPQRLEKAGDAYRSGGMRGQNIRYKAEKTRFGLGRKNPASGSSPTCTRTIDKITYTARFKNARQVPSSPHRRSDRHGSGWADRVPHPPRREARGWWTGPERGGRNASPVSSRRIRSLLSLQHWIHHRRAAPRR